MKSIPVIAVMLTTVMMLIAVPTLVGIRTQAQTATQLPANIGNMTNPVESSNHLPVQTVQDENHIVTTVTKKGEAPTGPVVIIPPSESHGGNGSILTPGENSTVENPGNITIISPGGNVTEIPGNITNVGNDTIIIAPPDRNITETPGNVTIVDPPRPTQLPVIPPAAPCTCNQTQAPTPIPPVTITPAPGQNVTTLPHPAENATAQPLPLPPAENNSGGNQSSPSGNQTTPTPNPPPTQPELPGNNQTGNITGNETQPANPPVTNATEPPHPTQLPASYNMFPGFHITAVNYNGPNSQWLKK